MPEDVELDWLSPAELRIWRAFNRAHEVISAKLDEEVHRDIGLPRSYLDILFRLERAPGRALRMAHLAELTHSKASRITHAVGRLEESGLVRREVPDDDRRGWLAVLTDEGVERLMQAAPHYARSIRENYLAILTGPMREQITAIGETLLEHFQPERNAGAEKEKGRQ
ncbi:hypothetical protein A5717_24405 [Mycolicibacterium porcinum]|uniref:MarR family winged helix-turn-helix transcriptional regulator n=1 Tax=Mycolicibacterium porcinum TaxID=39693 RepID=UPI00080B90A7|nr:MarR family transcriptional regulator [Mycolicibacterium porcinum]OCB09888.1 hypothetical protein A5717_24405 [Mycolicibacterium porcinum]